MMRSARHQVVGIDGLTKRSVSECQRGQATLPNHETLRLEIFSAVLKSFSGYETLKAFQGDSNQIDLDQLKVCKGGLPPLQL
jgi:hypothetical protein